MNLLLLPAVMILAGLGALAYATLGPAGALLVAGGLMAAAICLVAVHLRYRGQP